MQTESVESWHKTTDEPPDIDEMVIGQYQRPGIDSEPDFFRVYTDGKLWFEGGTPHYLCEKPDYWARLRGVSEEHHVEFGAWVPVAERLPDPGSVVLLAYRNRLDHWRQIRAEWVAARTLEAEVDNELAEYDEATDEHYLPEGWYECINNWDDHSLVYVYEGEPSHWMRMPPPPTSS